MYGFFLILSQPYRKMVISSVQWSGKGDRADPARAAAGRAQRGQTARSRPRSSHQGAAIGSRAAAGTWWGPLMGLVQSGVRGTLLEEPRGQPAVAGWLWSPFPGPPAARLEIGSERRIHHAQIVQQPPGQREQRAASVPPRQSRDDGLPRTELPPPNFSLSGSQGEIESM